MKKKLFFAALALTALAGCTEETYMGDESLVSGERPISFTSGTPAITRAVGAEAANLLNNNFVVFGYKTVSSTPQIVFDNYQVNWATNTAGTSETNSADWEYVGSGIKNLPFGTATTSGGTLNTEGVSANASGSSTNVDQSIKYWDFSASAYDFFAYSLGAGSSSTWAKASAMNKTGYGDGSSHPGYTLEGTAAQLATCYISNMKNVAPSSVSAKEVDLEFRSFLSKIELKFYETIPGYSVKSLSFYPSADGAANLTPYLFAGSSILPTGGKYTVTFDGEGKAQLTLETSTPTPTYDTKTTAFKTTLTNYKGAEYKEDNSSAIYLGRASNDATTTNTISMLPNPQNANALNLKIDFTLVSRDGTGETINMTGATAVIPATYAKWLPNYKYTYIFKISDNNNASSGQSITGLYPITLDAVVTDAVDGTQTTITTVATPSITTYQKGSNAAINEYKTTGTNNIYVQVQNGGTLVTDLNHQTASVDDKSFFYSLSAAKTEAEVMDALNIREGEDAGVITGHNGLVLTPATIDNTITAIPGEDEHDITVAAGEAAKLTAASAGYYAYVYLVSTGASTPLYSAQILSSAPTDWAASAENKYYEDQAGTVQITTAYANPSFHLTEAPEDWVASSSNVYYSDDACTSAISSSFASLHELNLTGDAPGDWSTSDNVYYSDDECTSKITDTYASLHTFALTAEPADWNASDNVYYTDNACTTQANTAYADNTYYKKVHCYKKVDCYKKLVCYKRYTDLNNTYAVKVIKVVAE